MRKIILIAILLMLGLSIWPKQESNLRIDKCDNCGGHFKMVDTIFRDHKRVYVYECPECGMMINSYMKGNN